MGPKNPIEEHFDRGLWGYDGTRWRKLALLFGFTDTWQDTAYVASAGAGTYTKQYGPVPAGEVWVLNTVLAIDIASDASSVRFGVGVAALGTAFGWVNSPGVGVAVTWVGSIPIKEGDSLWVQIFGVIAEDNLSTSVVGYKMDVA